MERLIKRHAEGGQSQRGKLGLTVRSLLFAFCGGDGQWSDWKAAQAPPVGQRGRIIIYHFALMQLMGSVCT